MAKLKVPQLRVASHLSEAAGEIFNCPASPHWEHEDERMNENGVICPEDSPSACVSMPALVLEVTACFAMLMNASRSSCART